MKKLEHPYRAAADHDLAALARSKLQHRSPCPRTCGPDDFHLPTLRDNAHRRPPGPLPPLTLTSPHTITPPPAPTPNRPRRDQALSHIKEAPQLPTGYAGMIGLAWFPPLWRRVMDPRLVDHFDGDLTQANIQPGKRARVLGGPGAAV